MEGNSVDSSPHDQAHSAASPVSADAASTDASGPPRAADLDGVIGRARHVLLAKQQPEGCWCGELQGDSNLESEYILLLAWLDRLERPVVRKAARYLLQEQLPQGGWALFPGGEMDVSASVKAYFALKLAGEDPRSEPLRLAREAILAYGGADEADNYTRFYLALLGQIPFDLCPLVVPEMLLLPRWSPLNIFRVSAWSRAVLVPLSIVWAHRPARQLPESMGIEELMIRPVPRWVTRHGRQPAGALPLLSWERGWRLLEGCWRTAERLRLRPFRRRAVHAAEKWITDRFVDSDGLAAGFWPTLWSLVALKCLGYDDQSAEVRYCHEQLSALVVEENETVRMQPCTSPVWDTSLALRALASVGESGDEFAVARATGWLLSREVTRRGDWSKYVRAEPSGWHFEHHNVFYPDLGNTATVLSALREQYMPDHEASAENPDRLTVQSVASKMSEARDRALLISRAVDACQRARRWTLAMQNTDGGWSSFDKDNHRSFLCCVPLADDHVMTDPSTPDVTGRVLEALGGWGATITDEPIKRAVQYLRTMQEPDGSWLGRWGVNYIYGTWQCLVGLRQVGVLVEDALVQQGLDWLIRHQQACGGWGESPESYRHLHTRGQGRATATQTAWALLGLLACGQHEHAAVQRAVGYLVSRQQSDGSWQESEFTGTGAPRRCYLRYHLSPCYFPLLALGRYQQSLRRSRNSTLPT